MNKINIILILLILTISKETISQSNDLDCGFFTNSSVASGSIFGGSVKPNRTDSSGGVALPSDAYFPVLVVFVQFKNEASDPRNSWPTNSAPTYLNNIIARDKNSTGDWWSYYNNATEILSSQWAEISRGKFHVISPTPSTLNTAFSVVLPYEASHYDSLGNIGAELQINKDIWVNINSQGLTDWRKFDRWKYNSSTGYFEFKQLGQSDGLVDMIYKVHKSRGVGGLVDFAGYNALSWSNTSTQFLVDTVNNIKIDYGNNFEGSGVTVSFRGQLAQYIGTMGHEHGHQLFFHSGHSTYSRVSYGFGYDYFYSPADMILNGYMTPSNATMNVTNVLGDYSSRNTGNGEILKVPVQENEYFLLVSRNKVSKWDRVMIGDSAQVDTYGDNSEYGKGLYIYHVPNGLNFPGADISQQDMECADGLFEFEYAGQSAQQVVHDCYISGASAWYYYNKKKVLYENDSSNLDRYAPTFASRLKGDGISFRPYLGIINSQYAYGLKWWGEGDQPTSNCDIGTDRIFTNKKEIYTNFEVGGDRWDAWKPGYNEVFSPYSSPNTNSWADSNSGIFMWHYTYSGSGPAGLAYMKIYKAGTGGFSEDSILHLTPPSRPMGLIVMPCDSQPTINGYKRIKLQWNHNMEPDMLPAFGTVHKKYKIYRSYSNDMETVPADAIQYPENYYTAIATVDILAYETPSFIDSTFISGCNEPPDAACPPECWTLFPVRYRVQAIDRYNDVSVLSDFANTEAWSTAMHEGGEEDQGDNLLHVENNNIPKIYELNQNYPNPFNPTTNIQYDLPKDNFVSIKIYNILGKEVLSLVNEFKQAGSYLINFNGSNLSSGIYYYKIKAGNFEKVRKMVLIK